MIYPNKEEFNKLAEKGNLIPVYKEIVADMETPVSAYRKIAGECSFLLESVEGGEKIARYSFLGTSSMSDVLCPKSFEEIREILKRYKAIRIPGLPRFNGGLVGYISYDAVREIEKIPDKNPDTLNLPLMQFILADSLLVFDHIKRKIIVISNAKAGGYEQACAKIAEIENKLKQPIGAETELVNSDQKDFTSSTTEEEFKTIVKKAKAYIRSGDIIQVVLSQRLKTETKLAPFDIYRKLRMINPSPYMYYLDLGRTKVIGASPEVMVRLEGKTATLRPIAGTRPRGKTEEADKKLAVELLASKKERAEHIMLVDLGRNDLGRVCDYGTVKVTEEMTIERYSHVMHIVSNVTGKLKKGKDSIDLLKACFPAGTVSGAPKVRAMEIIDELENLKRGLYAGCVGYLSFSGDLDTAIAIRTILLKDNEAFIQAGAGIVMDSDPGKEHLETLNKARALLLSL
ncbi:MAG: anthranilate synthase component I [bacterium]